MRNLYLTFFLLIAGFVQSWAQTPTMVISNTSGDPGTVVSVDFAVRDFNNLIGMQFSINWDETVLRFRELKNITGSLRDFDAGAFNLDPRFVDDGIIIVSWFDQSAEPNMLSDGTVIFTLDFDVVGGAGSGTTVTISDEPRRIEIIDVDDVNVGLMVEGGVFGTGGGGGGDNLRFIASDEEGMTGDEVCIEVSVDGFTDITGMQFSLNWDASFLEFTEVRNFNLSGLNAASFNLSDAGNGKAVLSWTDPSSNGLTVASGTRIFDFCFRILGAAGSRQVEFSNDPLPIEAIDIDDNRVQFTKKDGSVTVGSDGGGGRECDVQGFALVISEEAPDPGEQFCMDVSVKGFVDMLSLAATIEWDNNILANPSPQNFDLNGLSAGLFNLDMGANGAISFLWTDPSVEGITRQDGDVIFQLCFDVIGENGQSTTVSFTDGITNREASNTSTVVDFQQCEGVVNVGGGGGGVSVSTDITAPCPGESNGSIAATVSGGNGPFTYSWTRDGTVVGSGANLADIGEGTYTLVVTDNDGVEVENTQITVGPAIVITGAEITDATDGMDGSVNLTVTGSGLQYSWSTGVMTEDLLNVGPGSYTVTITDDMGCDLIESYTVGGQGGVFNVIVSTSDFNGIAISCNGECDATATAEATGGLAPYTFSWSNGETTASVTGLCAGEISVTVSDSDGSSATQTITISEPDVLSANVETTPAPTGPTGTALANVSGGTMPYTYRWNDNDPPSTTRLINNLAVGEYTVIVTDANGCQVVRSGRVNTDDFECFTGRLVITPNNDGMNDRFEIACAPSADNELEIFNRHGELVFTMDNYDNSWIGVENDGDELPDGGYFWVLRVRSGDGALEQYTGHVTVLRRLN